MRVTSDADQNLRVNPDDGTLAATDGTLNYAAGDRNAGANPNVVGSAYRNNFSGTTATVLYDIDSALDTLVIQNPPNSGTLNTVGSLGVNTSDNVGFDISGVTGTPYASLPLAALPVSTRLTSPPVRLLWSGRLVLRAPSLAVRRSWIFPLCR